MLVSNKLFSVKPRSNICTGTNMSRSSKQLTSYLDISQTPDSFQQNRDHRDDRCNKLYEWEGGHLYLLGITSLTPLAHSHYKLMLCSQNLLKSTEPHFKFSWKSQGFQRLNVSYEESTSKMMQKTSKIFPFDGMVQPKKHVSWIWKCLDLQWRAWTMKSGYSIQIILADSGIRWCFQQKGKSGC